MDVLENKIGYSLGERDDMLSVLSIRMILTNCAHLCAHP